MMARALKSVRADLARLRSFGSAVGGVMRKGFIFAAAGLATLTAGFLYSMKIIKEQEDADLRLENAVTKMGASLGYTAQELKAYAVELQRVTSFGDETLQNIISMLALTGKLSGPALKRATEALLDAIVGVDKKDWHRIGKSLAAAFQDPEKAATALSAAGIELSETEDLNIKRMVRLGREGEVLTLVLSKLESRYGGLARKQRQSVSGGWEGLKNQIGDAMQELVKGFARGMNLEEVFKKAEGRVGAFAERIGKMMEPIGARFADALGKAFSADPKLRSEGVAAFGSMLADAFALVSPWAKRAGELMAEGFVETAKSLAPAWMRGAQAGIVSAGEVMHRDLQPATMGRRALTTAALGPLSLPYNLYHAVKNIQQPAAAAGAAYGASPGQPLYVSEVHPIDGVSKR